MEKYNLVFTDQKPKYIQLYGHIKKLMDMGYVEDGEKLPTMREMSSFLHVNKSTVISAYEKLKSEGLALLKVGSGTYAKKKELSLNFKKAYKRTFKNLSKDDLKEYIDYTGEAACSEYFPVTKFKEVIDEVLDRDGSQALSYTDSEGYEGLRASIGKKFWGSSSYKDKILIVTGAQQGIDLISKTMINVNDSVIVEKPTYSGALSVFVNRRANIFDIEMQDDGIDLEKMEKVLKANKIKCFYTMSYFQNPTGITTSKAKKMAILNLAKIYDFYIIEDDYLSDMRYDKSIEYTTYKSLDHYNRVFYIKSFSKIFLPGIRIGYLIPPKKYLEACQNYKLSTDIGTSTLMQRALELYIEKGYFEEYLEKLLVIYESKYAFMKEKIDNILGPYVNFIAPSGGFSFYLEIKKDNINSMELFYKALEKKVILSPGVLYYKNEEEGERYFKLAYAEIEDEAIVKGLKLIRDCFEASSHRKE